VEYKIGSFNVKNLNYSSEKVDEKTVKRSFETIAEIIKKEEFAIVALQEVLSGGAMQRIMQLLGKNGRWQYRWERPMPKFAGDKADKRGEGYAYIWDTDKVDLTSVDVDDETRKFLPRIWHQYQQKGVPLVREPYYARFSPIGKVGGCFCEIRLINTHIVYGDTSKVGVQLRQSEFLKIVQSVYKNIANKRYGNNMPAYIIVLGDYNLEMHHIQDLKNQTVIQVGNSDNARREELVLTRQAELTTINHIKQDDDTYSSDYVSNYDHFSFIERYEKIMNIGIERIDPTRYCEDLVEYWETVTDHVPIKMTIGLNKRNAEKLNRRG